MSSKYCYTALPSADEHIRLLVLLPGPDVTTPLCGMLRTVRLAHAKGKFEAVSYTWGDERSTSTLQIENESTPIKGQREQCSIEDLLNLPFSSSEGVAFAHLPVTPNLDAALRRFRLGSKPRVLWVDAVCIQQADLHEKAQQVQLMGMIYSLSFQTLAWLGTIAPQYSSKCFAYCKAVSALKDQFMMTDENIVDDSFSQRRAGLLRNGFAQLLLWVLFRRPWFGRLWCVQEAILPDRVLLCWGEHMLGWEIFQDVVDILGLIVRSEDLVAQITSSWVSDGSLQSLESRPKRNPVSTWCWAQPCQIVLARNRFHGLAPRASTSWAQEITGCPVGGAQEQTLNNRESLLRLMTQFSEFGCKDPRDRIFALLGICRPTPIIPDYTRSFEEIVLDASISLLQAGDLHQLHYLKSSAAIATSPQASSLPSYATFLPHHKQTTIPIGEETKYSAATCVKPYVIRKPPSFHLPHGVVSIAGYVIAPITRIVPNDSSTSSFFSGDVPIDPREYVPARAVWLTSVYIALTFETMPAIAYRTGITVATAVGLTLGLGWPLGEPPLEILHNMVDHITGDVSSDPNFLLFLRHSQEQLTWLDLFRLGQGLQTSRNSTGRKTAEPESHKWLFAKQALSSMSIQTWGRDAALFEGGWVGLVPQGCRQGDQAVIIEGATTPFIVRREEGDWRLLGDSYIEGLMKGEAMQMEGLKREMFSLV